MDKDFINVFLYDILINSREREKVFLNSKFICKGKLVSFLRVFNVKSNDITVPNIDKSDLLQYVSGIVVKVDSLEFHRYAETIENCEIVEVDIKAYNGGEIRASLFRVKHFEALDFNFESEKQMRYLKNCLEGVKEHGEEFLKDFKKTTFIGRDSLDEIDYL